MSKIKSIHAREVLDSRGNPTVEAEVVTESGHHGRASVPSGASTGMREALELRDGDKSRFLGKGVLKAVSNVKEKITPALIGFDVLDQRGLDQKMLDLDGTENKENLGANAILAVSMAACRAAANVKGKELFVYLREDCKVPLPKGTPSDKYILPNPLMNIINGGAHASNNLDIQEFMIIPHMKKSFAENLRAGAEVFHNLKKVLSKQEYSTNVGDEGGFAPSLKSHEEAMTCISEAIESAGYKVGQDISFALDCASSEFHKDGKYHFEGRQISSDELVDYYSQLVEKFPIYSIEDGLGEADGQGWVSMTKALGEKAVLVGDDLFVTNKKILGEGIELGQGNSILVKVNQIGSLSETFDTLKLAFENDYSAIISHRSGETGDSFIADLAVACNAGHIKTGSASRSDRMEKYNQLLRIEETLGDRSEYRPVK